MELTHAERRLVLVNRISSHARQEEDLRAAAHEHKRLADQCRRELELLDTPELPNLFPECPQTPSNQAPTESRPSTS